MKESGQEEVGEGGGVGEGGDAGVLEDTDKHRLSTQMLVLFRKGSHFHSLRL